ncbi:efflux RND transporter periplasmic adaptor subunit [Candidatus Dactylopiibacterium carminicum]|nr:efflux RND transporter periplasmic adaptor subunit [Candidatus Dactylopiibacterium carminicum]
MKRLKGFALPVAGIASAGLILMLALSMAKSQDRSAQEDAGHAALTVTAAGLQPATMPLRIAAGGNIMAWQEASIGTEASGMRLVEVRVNVGDAVRRGQLLASFAAETVAAELAQARAALAEADVALADAAANAWRARVLQESGALSAQQIQQYMLAERAVQARLEAARALETVQQVKLAQTRIHAPDDGLISARSASVGAVMPAGQELFRLIRGGRLEWRAEVSAADLARLRPGQTVRLASAEGSPIEGRLRKLAPVIDLQTRNGLAYVDLAPDSRVRAGMFVRGEFELGTDEVMTLPQSAVLLHEGFSYVMRIGQDSRVTQTKVIAGRHFGERIEIVRGLGVEDRVVASGAAFLGDGDRVRVVEAGSSAVSVLSGREAQP